MDKTNIPRNARTSKSLQISRNPHFFPSDPNVQKKSIFLSLAASTDTHFLSLESETFGQLGTDLSLQRTELDGIGDSTVWAHTMSQFSQTLREKNVFFLFPKLSFFYSIFMKIKMVFMFNFFFCFFFPQVGDEAFSFCFYGFSLCAIYRSEWLRLQIYGKRQFKLPFFLLEITSKTYTKL